MRDKRSTIKGMLLVLILGAYCNANATVWTVDAVLGGSSGFGASSFHDASDDTPMTGNILAAINASGSGSYDDVTGAFAGTFAYGFTGFSLNTGSSSLIFTVGDQFLDTAGSLDATFTSQNGQLIDAAVNFTAGPQCCGGTDQDPNSFVVTGSGDTAVLTLWGFTGIQGTDVSGNPDNTIESHVLTSDYGMDLRLGLSKTTTTNVPTPPGLALFGLGLLGLGLGLIRKPKLN